jgi:hypothetical protein
MRYLKHTISAFLYPIAFTANVYLHAYFTTNVVQRTQNTIPNILSLLILGFIYIFPYFLVIILMMYKKLTQPALDLMVIIILPILMIMILHEMYIHLEFLLISTLASLLCFIVQVVINRYYIK